MVSNGLSYEGVVSLKIIDAKSKNIKKQFNIHNNGSNTLFYFLCKCLKKEYDEQYAPLAIDASTQEYIEGNEDSFTSCLAYRVLLSDQGILENVKITLNENELMIYSYVTRFSAIIPYSVMTLGESNDTTIKCFQLHAKLSQSDKLSSLLAWINLEEGIAIANGEALLIEWNMGFTNPQ